MAGLRLALVAAVAGVSLVAGAAAMSAALAGHANPGITTELQGGSVLAVSTSGLAWRDGIRAGQIVIGLDDSLSPGGWRLETWDGSQRHVTTSAPVDEALRNGWLFGIIGLGAGCLSVLFVLTSRPWAVAACCLAILASSHLLSLQGDPVVATSSLAAAMAIPALWLAGRLRGPLFLRGALVAAVVALLGWWTIARLGGLGGYPQFEAIRGTLAVAGTGAVLLEELAIRPGLQRDWTRPAMPRPVAAITVVALGGIVFVLTYVGAVSPMLISLVLLAGTLLTWTIRKVGGDRIQGALLSDLLDRVSIDASELERARIAGEIHDVPLQQLAGVIRRLDALPGAREANEALRDLARDLRLVAANQRPPTLDDLGLVAGLESLAGQMTTAQVPVRTRIADRTGIEASTRPPPTVEIAIFRIVQEAVSNAVRHSQPSETSIEGEIARDRIDLAVIDDGIGLQLDAERAAARRGRLGLQSMRRRARAIGAELSIVGSNDGTTVRLRWQR